MSVAFAQNFPPFPPYATYQPATPVPPVAATAGAAAAAGVHHSGSTNTAPRRPIAEIRPGIRDLNLSVIIIDKYLQNEPHRVTTLLWIGDESGSVIAHLPGAKPYEQFKKGDMLDITNCEARLQRGRMEVFLNPKLAKCEKYSEDLQVFEPEPNMSHLWWRQDPHNKGGWVYVEADKKSSHWYDPPLDTSMPVPHMSGLGSRRKEHPTSGGDAPHNGAHHREKRQKS
ncbi:hypothetical protein HDU89_002822 [Geranomyces variabilis]|nr:hypothetical protein HDU89_002822 [Geranomyces variabilis]